jgi:hypothetical protein
MHIIAGITLPTQSPRLKNRWQNPLLVLGIFALAAFPRLIRLGEFVATDEFYIWELANRFFLALSQGRLADTVVHGYPAITLMWIEAVGVWIRYAALWLLGRPVNFETLLGLDTSFAMLPDKQIVLALVNSLLVAVMFCLARKAYGLPAALIGSVLIAFDPFLLAESRVVRTEGLVSGLMTLSVLALLVFFRTRHRRYLLVSALMAGMSALTKVSALLLIPVAWAALIFYGWSDELRGRGRINLAARMAKLILWTLVFALAFWALWPAMWVAPIDTLRVVTEFSQQAGEEGLAGRGVFFWGQVYPDDPGPWFYPVALLFRTTPLCLLGVILAVITMVVRALRIRTGSSDFTSAASDVWLRLGVTTLLFYCLFFIFAMSLGAKKYDRYLMPVFPVLDLVAGVGLVQISKVGHSLRFDIWYLILVVALVLQPLTALPHLPYFYTYYNPLLGGIKQAAKVMHVGYGEGLDVAARCLESKPNVANIRLASGNSSKLQGLFSGKTIPIDNLDGRWIQGDYVMLYISQLQRGRHRQSIVDYVRRQSPECVVVLHGLEYAWVYPGPAAKYYSGTKLEGRGTLYGYSLSATELRAGEILTATVYFINEGQLPSDRFYVRLVDADGYVWTQDTVRPRPGFEDAFRTRKAIVEGEAALALPVGMSPGQYVLKMGYEDGQTGQSIGEFVLPADGDDMTVKLPRAFPALGSIRPPVPLDFVFLNELSLSGYELSTDRVTPGKSMWLTLYWQALTDVSHDYVIGLQLLDATGAEATYWLGRPVRSSYATDQWQKQQVVQDPWRLDLPPEVSPGDYTLRLTLFDAETQAEVGRVTLGQVSVVRRERKFDVPDMQKVVNAGLGDQVTLLECV